MPNFEIGTIDANEPGREGVGTFSLTIIPENTSRVGLTVVNISDGTVYLGIRHQATLQAGIVLNPGGGAWSMDEYSFSKEAITAIAHDATMLIAFQEFENRA